MPELGQLRGALATGFFATAHLWPPLQTAHTWIQRTAAVLANPGGTHAATVEAALRAVRLEVLSYQSDPALAPWATHFYKVTMNYWSGLFHCYADVAIPRTNNGLEQYFGAARHHERRATGHKSPTAAVVVRGTVRVVAAVAARGTRFTAADLQPSDLAHWRQVRAALEVRHERRRAARRFRRDRAAYRAALEAQLLHESLLA